MKPPFYRHTHVRVSLPKALDRRSPDLPEVNKESSGSSTFRCPRAFSLILTYAQKAIPMGTASKTIVVY